MSEDKNGYNTTLFQEVAYEITPEMKYNPRCLCDNTGCVRHSNCRACVEFHRVTAHPPTCRYHWEWKQGKDIVIK